MGVLVGQPLLTLSWVQAVAALSLPCRVPTPPPAVLEVADAFSSMGPSAFGPFRRRRVVPEALLASRRVGDATPGATGLSILRHSLHGEKTEAEVSRLMAALRFMVERLPQSLPDAPRWKRMIENGGAGQIIRAIEEMDGNPLARRLMQREFPAALARNMLAPSAPSAVAKPPAEPKAEPPDPPSLEDIRARLDAILAARELSTETMNAAGPLLARMAAAPLFGATGKRSPDIRQNIARYVSPFLLLGDPDSAMKLLGLLERHALASGNFHVKVAALHDLQNVLHFRSDRVSDSARKLLLRSGQRLVTPTAAHAAAVLNELAKRFPRAITAEHIRHLDAFLEEESDRKNSRILRSLLPIIAEGTEQTRQEAARVVLERANGSSSFLHLILEICQLCPQRIRSEDLHDAWERTRGDGRKWFLDLAERIFQHIATHGTPDAAECARQYLRRLASRH